MQKCNVPNRMPGLFFLLGQLAYWYNNGIFIKWQEDIRVFPLSRLLVPHLRCAQNSCCSFSPGKHAWKFSNGSIPSDLRGCFVGGVSPSFTIRMERGSNWGFPSVTEKNVKLFSYKYTYREHSCSFLPTSKLGRQNIKGVVYFCPYTVSFPIPREKLLIFITKLYFGMTNEKTDGKNSLQTVHGMLWNY